MGESGTETARQVLAAALSESFATERVVATASAARVRVAGSVGALGLVLLLALLADSVAGRGLVLPVGLHTLAAAMFLVLVSRSLAARTAWLMASLDLAMLTVILVEAQRLSERPQVLSSAGLALFILLVVLNAQALSSRTMCLMGAAAAGLKGWLAWSSGDGLVAVVLSVSLIAAAVAMSRLAQGATRRLVRRVAREHVGRLGERSRADELEAARDTIERMLVEARERNARLEELQRDRDNLTHLLVHDLRTPLTAVIGNVEWVHDTLAREGGASHLIEASQDALDRAQRLASMIGDILDVARLEDGRLEPRLQAVQASDVLSEVRAQAQRSSRGQALIFEVEVAEALEVEADRELMRRILENLVSNGLRFARTRIRLTAQAADDEIELRVQNDGPRIEEGRRARLFEKFGRAGSEHLGWGLGLYFCRLATEVHGGHIEVVDDGDWNVSFVVRLPVRARALAA